MIMIIIVVVVVIVITIIKNPFLFNMAATKLGSQAESGSLDSSKTS